MSSTAGTSLSVSIVITNYNYARFVGHAIESALDQRDANVEVIVVDDGSTDDSRQIIDGLIDGLIDARGGRITAVFTPNHGQGAAFNTGWQHSTGDVVLFLDADDTLLPDTAARVAAEFARCPQLSRVQFPLVVVDAAGRPTGTTIPRDTARLFRGDAVAALTHHPDDIVWQPTSGNAFSRPALDRILPMPEAPYRICADYFLSNLAPLHGPVAVLERPGGAYRVHGRNAEFADVDTPARLRDRVVRTSVTHRHLIEATRALSMAGLPDDPDAVTSVTAAATRLISWRIDRLLHPLANDTRWTLVRLGIRSALGRRDRRAAARLVYAVWFLAAATVPRRLLHVVARPYISIAPLVGSRSGVLDEAGDHEEEHDDGGGRS